MRIVAGSYEGFCYGWECSVEPGSSSWGPVADGESRRTSSPSDGGESGTQALSLAFGYSVHLGCMKSVALANSGSRAGRLLVTGGVDERIRIYDVRDKTELGELQQHKGTITCMEFYQSSHLLTGSEDRCLCIWRVQDWSLLHVLGGHKGAITSLSIHPSGRMALSVSRDRTMRLWNLLEGRCAYIKRLQGEGELVRWSAEGESYLVVVGSSVVVYSAATAEAIAECSHPSRVRSACFLGRQSGEGGGVALATAADDKVIRFFLAQGGGLIGQFRVGDVCQSGRVRDMCHVAYPEGAKEGGALVAVTSVGSVHVWGVPASLGGGGDKGESTETEVHELELPLRASLNVKGEPRFTCVSASLSGDLMAQEQPSRKTSKKRKHGHGTPAGDAGDNATLEDEKRGPGGETSVERLQEQESSRRKKKKERRKAAGDGVKSSPVEERRATDVSKGADAGMKQASTGGGTVLRESPAEKGEDQRGSGKKRKKSKRGKGGKPEAFGSKGDGVKGNGVSEAPSALKAVESQGGKVVGSGRSEEQSHSATKKARKRGRRGNKSMTP